MGEGQKRYMYWINKEFLTGTKFVLRGPKAGVQLLSLHQCFHSKIRPEWSLIAAFPGLTFASHVQDIQYFYNLKRSGPVRRGSGGGQNPVSSWSDFVVKTLVNS